MKEFAYAAHRRGYTVLVPSLPGYGTQPSDLIGITAEEWLDEGRAGVDILLRDCGTVAVVGHSIGGVLALVLAAEDRRISRVATWAAPWKIRNRLLPLMPIVSKVPLAKRLIPERLPVETPVRLKEMGWVVYDWLPGSIGLPILDSIKSAGIEKETLVIFTSDNGAAVGSSLPLRGRKASVYDGGIREPTLMWWPGKIPAGSVCKEVAASVDMMPTLAGLAGGELPTRKIDGKNVWPLMSGVKGAV